VNATGGGHGFSFSPIVSPEGTFVVFASRASDLVSNDTNGQTDVFLRDVRAQTTLLLSINANGSSSGNDLSSTPILSPDGRILVFGSFASDLVPGDYNQTRDVFVVRLASSDSDGDQMDDDWELTFFDTLNQDGTGDFDLDGLTDLDEFRAGTDPTNEQSVFRAITVRRMGGGSTTVLWAAIAGHSYQVEYKDAVGDSDWTALPGIVTARSGTGSYEDTTSNAVRQRFYRVRLVD
jgi:hypothetical protein